MKSILAFALLVGLGVSTQAQTKKGRESGYRYRTNSGKPAAPAAAPAKSGAFSPAKPATPSKNKGVRKNDGDGDPAPTPVPGALIRTAGVGTKTENHNPGWTYYGDMGQPQGWGYAINGGQGRALGGSGGGIRQGAPDTLPGRNTGGGSTPFGNSGSSGGNYQSWLSGINNTTINGNAHNNNQNNGNGNGN